VCVGHKKSSFLVAGISFALFEALAAVLCLTSAFSVLDSTVASLVGVAIETFFLFKLMLEVCLAKKFVIT